jgi:hypothetical protein
VFGKWKGFGKGFERVFERWKGFERVFEKKKRFQRVLLKVLKI